MDARTLMDAMSYPGYDAPLSLKRYAELVGPLEIALEQAGCTTVARVAMFLAQIGAESGSLRWQEELADGTAYNPGVPGGPWRALGNVRPGDGPRFKGRSFIQITGRTHYRNLSRWAYQQGYVPTRTFFLRNPERLADDRYAFLGPVWYWLVARPQMNALADAGDIQGATYAVNGGYNNLSGRTARWHKALSLGSAITTEGLTMDAEVKQAFAALNARLDKIPAAVWSQPITYEDPATSKPTTLRASHWLSVAANRSGRAFALLSRKGN